MTKTSLDYTQCVQNDLNLDWTANPSECIHALRNDENIGGQSAPSEGKNLRNMATCRQQKGIPPTDSLIVKSVAKSLLTRLQYTLIYLEKDVITKR